MLNNEIKFSLTVIVLAILLAAFIVLMPVQASAVEVDSDAHPASEITIVPIAHTSPLADISIHIAVYIALTALVCLLCRVLGKVDVAYFFDKYRKKAVNSHRNHAC